MMEATQYVELNAHGTTVIAGTRIHVDAVGFAHESNDYTEQELLAWFNIDRVQLYGALAYFYQHRDSIIARLEAADNLAETLSEATTRKLDAWRNQRDD